MTVEDLQEAFFNFDEGKTGYVSIETLRLLVTSEGEAMHDVSQPVMILKKTNYRLIG